MPEQSVSVIIPAFNSVATIARAIDSVLSQSSRADEIIVVDDGSTDGSADAVRKGYGNRVRLVQQQNAGVAHARNTGIAHASCAFVAFLDADDAWTPDRLACQRNVIAAHPEVILVGGRYSTEQPDGRVVPSELPSMSDCDRVLHWAGADAFRLAAVLWTSTVLVSRDVLSECPFDTSLSTAEDRDLWFRVVRRGPAYVVSARIATGVIGTRSLSTRSVESDHDNMVSVVHRYRRELGPIAARQWRAYLHLRKSGRQRTFAAGAGWLWRSIAAWPLPLTMVPTRDSAPRLRRAVGLALIATRFRKGIRQPGRG